jgi:hypothetical protein
MRDASIDYERYAPDYPRHRRADPGIAAHIHAALGDARTVLNVGADAAMAIITLHHWRDPAAGLRELRRVASGPVAVLTFDIDVVAGFWMISDYLPEALVDDRARFPAISEVAAALGGARVEPVAIPAGCEDGFFEAHYGRPEAYLDPALRAAQSVWPRLAAGVEQRALAELSADLASGEWDARHGHLRARPSYDGGLRLVVSG